MTGQIRAVRVLADLVGGSTTRDAALVIGGTGLVGAAAQLSLPVPGSPVPVTGQTFAVLLAGAALGTRRGTASLALYLVGDALKALLGMVALPAAWRLAGHPDRRG